MRILEWLWRKLPDKCRMFDCPRTGVRGNENVVEGIIMCDDCHAKVMKAVANWEAKVQRLRSSIG